MGKVFVSYSHDSPEHLNRVLALSNRLRREGVDCYIDQYEESPPEGWPTWCTNQVEDAEFVLVICTQVYDRRFRGREQPKLGLGVTWEGFVITQQLYDSASKNTKFVPVVFCSDDSTHIPITLRGATRYDLSDEHRYDDLYFRLTHQPSVLRPDLGAIRRKPPTAESGLAELPRKRAFQEAFRTISPDSGSGEMQSGKAETANEIPEAGEEFLRGTSTIQIWISQIFRIADIHIFPGSVRARKLLGVINDTTKMRRVLNRHTKFKLGKLGSVKPVAAISEEFDGFWQVGIPDFRRPNTPTLWFLPFELSLTEQLSAQTYDPHSLLGGVLGQSDQMVSNRQISGRLRIYPPGVGIVRLGITLTFQQDVSVEVVSRIARDVEQLVFVDPAGSRKPYEDVVLGIIEQVADALFSEHKLSYEARRWRPPETMYTVHDDRGFSPEKNIDALARIMSLAPRNQENQSHLRRRISAKLGAVHWQKDRVLASAAQGTAVIFLAAPDAPAKKRNRNRLQYWLEETAEVVSAAAFSEKAFFEEIDELRNQRTLDNTWLPGSDSGRNFEFLSTLLRTMRMVFQAIGRTRSQIQKNGTGVLMSFANDIWAYGNAVNPDELRDGLSYIDNWLARSSENKPDERIDTLRGHIAEIKAMPSPFRTGRPVKNSK